MKKTLLIIGMIGLASVAAQAESLTPEQALERAKVAAPAKIRAAVASEAQPQLVFTAYGERDAAAYVFNNGYGEGYMVLAADDVAMPVLGYSQNGAIDADKMPDGLRYWLDMYAREIAYAAANGAPRASASSQANSSWTAIAPLCSTKWNQSTPYNDLCPTNSAGAHAVTGCVATAMAQVMKYYNYPDKGTGTLTNSSMGDATTINLANMPFDWDNMLDSYGAGATDAQRTAVAELMLACGMSVNMSYSTQASGAPSSNVALALFNNFNYDKGCYYIFRDYYPLGEWQEYIYNNLKNVGPVLYSGSTANNEGHCFVCDGYDSNGYFHFNWGWGGMSDGYFLLTSLEPDAQGIGGASAGFNYDQEITLDVRKPVAGSKYHYEMLCSENFTLQQSNVAQGGKVTTSCLFYNGSPTTVSPSFALRFLKADGSVAYTSPWLKTNSSYAPFYGVKNLSLTLPTGMTAGTYRVVPIWKCSADETEREVRVGINYVNSYTATVSGTGVAFTPNVPQSSVSFSNMALESPKAYAGKRVKITAKATNNSAYEFYSTVAAGLYESGAADGSAPAYPGIELLIDVEAGQTAEIEYISVFGAPAGTYNLYFYDPKTYKWLSSPMAITLETAPTQSETVLQINSFGLIDAPNGEIYDTSNIGVQYDISCLEGLYDGKFWIGVAPGTSKYFQAAVETPEILLYANESHNYSAVISISSLKVNKSYSMYLSLRNSYNANYILAGPVSFKVVEYNSGIADVEGDEQPVSVEVYNLHGMKVEGQPTPGFYIQVATYADGSQKSTTILVK